MREIKFRAWDKHKNKMDNGFIMNSNGEILETMYGEIIATLPNYKLMQYTGLKDKNGKEIYEGDIIEWSLFPDGAKVRIRDVVEFKRGCFIAKNRMELLGIKPPHREIEVMGNIYENPELLE